MNRVVFLVDGFNLYHSVKDIEHYCQGLCVRWLNIYAFCQSFIYLLGINAKLKNVYYFSAYAHHLKDPDIIQRHKDYIKCLESTGVVVD